MFTSTPHLRIIEQPASTIRFRYETEGNVTGNLIAEHSTKTDPKFPAIEVVEYEGNEDIIVEASLVARDYPYRTHPHKLVGEFCKDGVYRARVNRDTMVATISNATIQCVKKTDMEASLSLRQLNGVDPFNQGFDHATGHFIDSNRVRLCFQLFTENDRRSLGTPVVSNEIHHQRSVWPAPVIVGLSHTSAPVTGGLEMIILCEKIDKDDIKVRFYQGKKYSHQNYDWEAYGEIIKVHKQIGIIFRTPPYTGQLNEGNVPVKAFVHLYKPSNQKVSEPREFQFVTPKRVSRPPPDGSFPLNKRGRLLTNPFAPPPQHEKSPPHRVDTTASFYESFCLSSPYTPTTAEYLSSPQDDMDTTPPSSSSNSSPTRPYCHSFTLHDMDDATVAESDETITSSTSSMDSAVCDTTTQRNNVDEIATILAETRSQPSHQPFDERRSYNVPDSVSIGFREPSILENQCEPVNNSGDTGNFYHFLEI